jgi:hypothetical protein
VYTSTQVQGSKTHFVGDLQMRYALKVSYFTLICSFFPSIPCRLSWCFGFNLVVVASGLSFAVTRGEGGKKVLGHVELTYQTFDIEHMLPWFWRASFLVGFVCTCLHLFANVVSVDSVLQMVCVLKVYYWALRYLFSFSPILWAIFWTSVGLLGCNL